MFDRQVLTVEIDIAKGFLLCRGKGDDLTFLSDERHDGGLQGDLFAKIAI